MEMEMSISPPSRLCACGCLEQRHSNRGQTRVGITARTRESKATSALTSMAVGIRTNWTTTWIRASVRTNALPNTLGI